MRTSVWAKRVQNRMAATGEGGMFAMEHDGDHDGLCTPSDVIECRLPQIWTGRILQRDKAFGEVVAEDILDNFNRQVGKSGTSSEDKE
jgi:hypothetical protein